MQRGLRWVETDDPRLARLWLAVAMGLAAALMLWAGRDTSFFSDEIQYFGRVTDSGVGQPFGLDYLFAPFNGHLQVVGKLVYEFLFATAGTNYFWYRLVEVLAYLVCVALFFELARPRVGSWAALGGSVVLLFLGAGWEVMLWPFDLHTLIALAAGLGALLVLERGYRRADLVACLLLLVSVATIEIGFAFAIGIAVSVLLRPDRRSRIWIFGVPVALYLVWSVSSGGHGAGQVDPADLSGLATSLSASLAATVAALTGLIDTGEGGQPQLAVGLGPELVIAVVLLIAFVWRISVAPVPRTTWVYVSILLMYWVFITLAFRQPDTPRYLLVNGMLVLLIAADLAGPVRVSGRALAVVGILVALALPLNVVKLFQGRDVLVREANISSSQYAMVELARDRIAPEFGAAQNATILRLGLTPAFALPAGAYLAAADRIDSLAMPLDRLREAPDEIRRGADLTLATALGLALEPTGRPASAADCQTITGSAAAPADVALPTGGALLAAEGADPLPARLSRFGPPAQGYEVGELGAGSWSELEIPPDSASEPWRLTAPGAVRVCALEDPA